jgi:hypothetical protein
MDMANKNHKFNAYRGMQSIHPTKLIEIYVLKVHPFNLLAYRISIVAIKQLFPKRKKKKITMCPYVGNHMVSKRNFTFSLQLILLKENIYLQKISPSKQPIIDQ